ncbi:chloride channel protein [Pandoraea anhela]|uniref:Chloride channel protein n=1 Tax=Pandoraea anhela TaxID=2508295 RepID=A0A5E4RL10_9BURK|nr:chloride channel protein [Pandoraea anhela]VVD62719.1 chloride channel protein [Pandoraea anhela]
MTLTQRSQDADVLAQEKARALSHPVAPAPEPTAAGTQDTPATPLVTLGVVTILIGIGAGVGGTLLAALLHIVQHLAFGYAEDRVFGAQSFLSGVTAASPERRFAALTLCGAVAGLGWYALHRYGAKLVSIKEAVGRARPMPVGSTLAHALLQIVTVALGSPLGREVAPREIGALVADRLARRAGLSTAHCRLLVACGAGAGLAAVYNVPLGGAIFVLEVLLGTFAWRAVLPAFATSAIAAAVAWMGMGVEQQYTIPSFDVTAPLMGWSLVCGPLVGAAAWAYARLTEHARANAPRDWRAPVFALANFMVLGLVVAWYPQVPGNGKGPASLAFNGELVTALAFALLALRVVFTWSSLRAGAAGGLLTPGLANGALLAVVLAGVWNGAWNTVGGVLPPAWEMGVVLGAAALIGATAFLAVSMRMPITAVVLALEFTHVNQDFLAPMLLAVAGAACTARWLDQRVATTKSRGNGSNTVPSASAG